MPEEEKSLPSERQYPPIYEKLVPIALVLIIIIVVVLLLIIVGVALGMLTG